MWRLQADRFQIAGHQPVYRTLATLIAITIVVSAGGTARGATAVVAGLPWHTDYGSAQRAAMTQQKMLLIHFLPAGQGMTEQQSLEQWIASREPLQEKLRGMVLARLPYDAEATVSGRRVKLLGHPAFGEMGAHPGVAILDYQNEGQPYYGHVVTALPFSTGKYYRWENSHLNVAVDLPPGTISQRTMVWAVRTHPETPASTTGVQHPALATAAAAQSQYQAQIGVQGHHRWDTRFHQIRSAATASSATEVVAESWPNQNLIDSCIDCVQSWRQSPGHWGAVRRRHRLFGYDIRRGRNGIWYGTGIFAN